MSEDFFSDDLREYVYSAEPGQAQIATLEIRHPAIVDPDNNPFVPRIANWETDFDATLEADAPANAGETVTFKACAFAFVPPNSPDQGTPSATVAIDNVASLLAPYLQAATSLNSPVAITARLYLADDLSEPAAIYSGLTVDTADALSQRVTLSLIMEDTLNAAFPDQIFTAEVYRGLVR